MPVFTSLISSSSGLASPSFLVSTTRSTAAVRAAHHAPVARRIVEHRRHHRRRRAAVRVRLGQLADRLGAHERHVPAQDHHRRAGLQGGLRLGFELGHRRRDRAAGAVRAAAAPPARRPPAAPPRAPAPESPPPRPARPRPPAPRAPATAPSAVPHSSCSTFGVFERMRVPWPAARIRTVGASVTPGDCSARRPRAGNNGTADVSARAIARATGEQGFEPRFSGPKPDVLPLDDSPRSPTSSHESRTRERSLRRYTLRSPASARIPALCSGESQTPGRTIGAVLAAARWMLAAPAVLAAAALLLVSTPRS